MAGTSIGLEGQWVQTTPPLQVEGIQHRRSQALAFAGAVRDAERAHRVYGVRVEPEPDNPRDPNAIKVIGFATVKPLFGPPAERRYHVGYIDRGTAAELKQDLVAIAHPFAAELAGVYRRGRFLAIDFHVLAPKGSPGALRTATRLAAAALDPQSPLTAEQRSLISQRQLGLYRNTRLEQAQALKKLGHFAEAPCASGTRIADEPTTCAPM